MAADSAPWAALQTRVSALEPARQAAFALACAERLVRRDSDKTELLESIAAGWAVLAGGTQDLTARLVDLDARSDIDEDDVACVRYAVGAVANPGADRSPLWASDRAIAAAYEKVSYAADAGTFRSLPDDSMNPNVQEELTWQAKALAVLEEATALSGACETLRDEVTPDSP
ncbi:MAG: hypothetical protein QM650_17410 [Microlunatus sp.]